MKKTNNDPRWVIITQGKLPVIVAKYDPKTKEEEVHEYQVKEMPTDKIVDTNGAGDSFTGGFLAAMALGKSIEDAVKAVSL